MAEANSSLDLTNISNASFLTAGGEGRRDLFKNPSVLEESAESLIMWPDQVKVLFMRTPR